MTLTSYNVYQQLATHIQQLLTQKNIPFPLLKTYITTQKLIEDVHIAIIEELQTLAENDKKEASADLERKALERQIQQDKDTKNVDEQDNTRDEHKSFDYISERAILINRQQQLEAQIRILEEKIARGRAQENTAHQHGHPSEAGAQTHQHGHPSDTATQTQQHEHPSETNAHTTHAHPSSESDEDTKQVQSLRIQLAGNSLRFNIVNQELHQIDIRKLQRKQRESAREQRLEIQVHLAKGNRAFTVYNALTDDNAQELKRQISSAHSSISSKRSALLSEERRANYSVFLQQLEKSLNGLKYSSKEKEAIQTILSLMKQHKVYADAADVVQAQRDQTISTISSTKAALKQANARVILLTQANPNLLTQNAELATKNTQLAQAQKVNTEAKDTFSLPAWVLAGLAVVSSIPLILALGGVITTALAPVAFYTLISLIPALSLGTSIGLGITSLIYGIKAAGNRRDIQKNTDTIQRNITQMGENDQELAELQNQTIPKYTKTIEVESQNQLKQEALLKEKKQLAQQILNQAGAVEPTKAVNQLDTPPPYDPINRNAFFSLVPYHGIANMPEPSAPPVEEMEGYNPYAYH